MLWMLCRPNCVEYPFHPLRHVNQLMGTTNKSVGALAFQKEWLSRRGLQ